MKTLVWLVSLGMLVANCAYASTPESSLMGRWELPCSDRVIGVAGYPSSPWRYVISVLSFDAQKVTLSETYFRDSSCVQKPSFALVYIGAYQTQNDVVKAQGGFDQMFFSALAKDVLSLVNEGTEYWCSESPWHVGDTRNVTRCGNSNLYRPFFFRFDINAAGILEINNGSVGNRPLQGTTRLNRIGF
jgi:hypothetical protein